MATAIVAPTTDLMPALPAFAVTRTLDAHGLQTIRVRGVLDASSEWTLRAELAAVPASTPSVLVDLAGVSTLTDECVRVLVAFCARLRRSGTRIALMAADHVMPAVALPAGEAFAVSVSAPLRLL